MRWDLEEPRAIMLIRSCIHAKQSEISISWFPGAEIGWCKDEHLTHWGILCTSQGLNAATEPIRPLQKHCTSTKPYAIDATPSVQASDVTCYFSRWWRNLPQILSAVLRNDKSGQREFHQYSQGGMVQWAQNIPEYKFNGRATCLRMIMSFATQSQRNLFDLHGNCTFMRWCAASPSSKKRRQKVARKNTIKTPAAFFC